MLRKSFIFSASFSVVGLSWAYLDPAFFGRAGWIITGLFSVLLTVLLSRNGKRA